MVGDIHISITEKQREFLGSTSWGTIFRSGIGAGKTTILCYKAILNALHSRRELICSFSYPMLRDVVAVTMCECMSKLGLKESEDWTRNKTEMTFNVRGNEILLRSGDAPDSLRGLNIHDALIDEMRQFGDRSIFDILAGRIRNAEDSKWYGCTTPNGKDWAWSLGNERDVKVITQRTDENPFLPKGYVDRLRQTYTGVFAAQELDGEIVELIGEVINPEDFKRVPPIQVSEGVRFWDLAFSGKKTSDWSVGALCLMSGAQFAIADIVRVKAKYPDLRQLIIQTAIQDGTNVRIGIEEAGQQRGFIDDLARAKELRGHVIVAQRPAGSKLARAMPWVSRSKLGEVKVVQAHWTDNFYAECSAFRADMTHTHDDMVDSVSGAYQVLNHTQRATSQRISFGG